MEKFYTNQRQENLVTVRLRGIGGNFSQEQLFTIWELAKNFGAGFVHLTSRQEIAIPSIKKIDLPQVEKIIAESQLEPASVGETFKTVTACQGSEFCKFGQIDTLKIAAEIEKRHAGEILPHKFNVGVTGCPHDCMKVETNDIGIKGTRAGFIIYLRGEKILPIVKDAEKVFEIVDAVIKFFAENAKPHEKFKLFVKRAEWKNFVENLSNIIQPRTN